MPNNLLPIHFIQYLRPNGRQQQTIIERPEEIANLAIKLQEAGYDLDAEVLQTNQISFTVTHPDTEHVLAIELVNNGPKVPEAVDRLITRAFATLQKEQSQPQQRNLD